MTFFPPQAALAAIVVVALKGLYLQVRDIYKYYRLSLADMVISNASFYTHIQCDLQCLSLVHICI